MQQRERLKAIWYESLKPWITGVICCAFFYISAVQVRNELIWSSKIPNKSTTVKYSPKKFCPANQTIRWLRYCISTR